jgi:hypothetical protein
MFSHTTSSLKGIPMLRSCWIVCALVICWASFAHAAPTIEEESLRYKFKEGEKLTYQIEQAMKMEMSFAGMDVTVELKQTFDMVMRVDKVDKDGNATITHTFNRIRMVMDSATGKAQIDTKDGADPADPTLKDVAKALRVLSEAEVKSTLDARGRVSNVKLSEAAAKALKELPAGAAGGDEMFTEEGMARLISQGGVILPEKSPSKGATWSNKIQTTTVAGKSIANLEYKHEGSATRGDRMLDKFSMKPTATLEVDKNAPVKMTIKSQEGSGNVYFDRKNGRLIESVMNQELNMEASTGGQELKQKVKSTISMKLLEPAK